MKTFNFLFTVALFAAFSTGCGSGSHDPSSDAVKPNIVLLVVDTLRGDYVLNEAGLTVTPGFDLLAEHGVVFPAAFSHAPMTLPSHTSLFSSRPPFETGVLNNWQSVRDDLPLLAEWLGRYGYQTHAVVSLGTLDKRENPALDRGFDEFDQEYWQIEQAPDALARIRTRLDELETDRPFFFFAHFSDPHTPYNLHEEGGAVAEVLLDGEPFTTLRTSDMSKWEVELPLEAGTHELVFRSEADFRINAFRWTHNDAFMGPEWAEGKVRTPTKQVRLVVEAKEQITTDLRVWISEFITDGDLLTDRYRAEVEWMDASIGEFVQELKTRGLYENTILVFTSDHGEGLGEHGDFGHIHNLYDEMIHVPLVIKPVLGDARLSQLESVRNKIVPHQDLVPTILELAAVPTLPDSRGKSLLALDRNSLLIAQTHKPESKHNLICFRDDLFKLIYNYDEDQFEMFDLKADPLEKVNVFESRQAECEDWVVQIRGIADVVKNGAFDSSEVSEQTQELLDALGY